VIEFIKWPVWSKMDQEAVKKWLEHCAHSYGKEIGALNYTFLEDRPIEEMNSSFLNHPYPTDIITFDYSDNENLEGEIFIGHEVVLANADDYGVSPDEELCRVMVHGVLHMLGLKDHDERESLAMRENEDKCLLLRPKNLKNK
jgi:probable rRNA maturation factor